jgi:DNA polymerase-1
VSTQIELNREEETPTLYLIDGSAYIYRAYHAVRGLSNSSGLRNQCHLRVYAHADQADAGPVPGYVAMFFDAKGPTFRHERYAAYKANRPPMPDDLVSSCPGSARSPRRSIFPFSKRPGTRPTISSAPWPAVPKNADFAWSWSPGTRISCSWSPTRCTIWDPMKDKSIDPAVIREILRSGCPPDDRRDGPVRRHGGQHSRCSRHRAEDGRRLIQTFGSMDGVYAGIDTITAKKQKEKLLQFKRSGPVEPGTGHH